MRPTSPSNSFVTKWATTFYSSEFARPSSSNIGGAPTVSGPNNSSPNARKLSGGNSNERPSIKDLSQAGIDALLGPILRGPLQLALGSIDNKAKRERQAITNIINKFRDEPEDGYFLRDLQDKLKARDEENQRTWVLQQGTYTTGDVPQVSAELGKLVYWPHFGPRYPVLGNAVQERERVNRLLDECTIAAMHIIDADLQQKEFEGLKERVYEGLTSALTASWYANGSGSSAGADVLLKEVKSVIDQRQLACHRVALSFLAHGSNRCPPGHVVF
jgi:hypothetical protein